MVTIGFLKELLREPCGIIENHRVSMIGISLDTKKCTKNMSSQKVVGFMVMNPMVSNP